jgi:hypothetical protein
MGEPAESASGIKLLGKSFNRSSMAGREFYLMIEKDEDGFYRDPELTPEEFLGILRG